MFMLFLLILNRSTLSVSLFVHQILRVGQSGCQSVSLIALCIFVSLFIFLSVCLIAVFFACLFDCLFVYQFKLCPLRLNCIFLVCLSVCLSVLLSARLMLYILLSVWFIFLSVS